MKTNYLRIALALLLLSQFAPALFADDPVPTNPSIVTVQVNDRRLFVQNRLSNGTLEPRSSYVIKGVNWAPTSIGSDQSFAQFSAWYQTDIAKMKAMGINTVRTYHDLGTSPQAFAILDELYKNGIKVIMQVDFPFPSGLATTQQITNLVNAYKNHPAILMWAVGSEWDINHYFGAFSNIQQSAAFTEQNAQLVKSLDSNHPICTYIADPHIPNIHPLSASQFPYLTARPYTQDIVNNLVPSIDVWGINIYRGNSFQDVFQMWRSISTKPVFIGEFGSDDYDHRINSENQTMQSQMDSQLWDEIFLDLSAERINGTAIGGTVFEWNDEWWKNGNNTIHTITNEANGGQLDGFNDEEWFGLVDINRNVRSAYTALQNRFLNGQNAVAFNANPVIRAISQGTSSLQHSIVATFQIGDKTVFSRAGGGDGARGINVAILDTNNGIRMKEVKSFDTWLSPSGFGSAHTNFQVLADYLNSLPNGTILLLSIADDGGFINSNSPNNPQSPWGDSYVELGYQTLEALGSTQIRNVQFHKSWAMITKKGVGKLAEMFGVTNEDVSVVEAQVSLNLNPNSDKYTVQGDANGNGIVDASDYVVWRKNSGWSGTPGTNPADFDNNGQVNQVDYNIWRGKFGNSIYIVPASGAGSEVADTSAVSSSVPVASEPISISKPVQTIAPEIVKQDLPVEVTQKVTALPTQQTLVQEKPLFNPQSGGVFLSLSNDSSAPNDAESKHALDQKKSVKQKPANKKTSPEVYFYN